MGPGLWNKAEPHNGVVEVTEEQEITQGAGKRKRSRKDSDPSRDNGTAPSSTQPQSREPERLLENKGVGQQHPRGLWGRRGPAQHP